MEVYRAVQFALLLLLEPDVFAKAFCLGVAFIRNTSTPLGTRVLLKRESFYGETSSVFMDIIAFDTNSRISDCFTYILDLTAVGVASQSTFLECTRSSP